MNFLAQLNDRQRRAVIAPQVPMMVLAGPGTGKTRTLVARILYQIQHERIAPHRIMAVTFTNKARDEMRQRVGDELGDLANDVLIGTFHHYCLDVLRAYYHEANIPKQFAIADEISQLITLSRATRINDQRSLRTVLTAISSYRMSSKNLNDTLRTLALRWMRPYHEELRKNNLIDFDQIILYTRDLFTRHAALVETQQNRFDAILVDEFQDTDSIQYEILRLLAQRHRNIFAVADDDQSIFAWRGANTGNIDRYIKEFVEKDHVIVLNENYRSAQCIIDLAARLLRGHRFIAKEIVSSGAEKQRTLPPEQHIIGFADDDEEREFMLDHIRQFTADSSEESERSAKPLRYADIAILYPNHAIGEELEANLLAAHIPCQLVKRQGVFDQDDIKNIILLLKLLQNPEDDVTLEQYIERTLDNQLVFEQLSAFKSEERTFKQTLRHAMRTANFSGMPKGRFRKIINAAFATISNLLSYIEQNPTGSFEELINTLCNLVLPTHSLSIHRHVHQLRDPLAIPGMTQSVAAMHTALQDGGKLYVGGSDADITRICYRLLKRGLNVARTDALRLLSEENDLTFSDADLLLCLDVEAAETARQQCPGIDRIPGIVIFPQEEVKDISPRRERENFLTLRSPFHAPLTIFKLLQAFTTFQTPLPFRDYIVFDLETTSADPRTTGIVEIGAAKVRDGKIVETFGRLVNPEQPITQGAYKVHGISEAEVRHQPTFKELLPEFLQFIGNDLLVAHNGFEFDYPILWRMYHRATGGKMLTNRRFDTLPLARGLFPGQPASVDALMQRFQIEDSGSRHRALDDTVFLAPIFQRLQEVEQSVNRRSEHENLLELVALGLFLDHTPSLFPEDHTPAVAQTSEIVEEERLLFRIGVHKLLSRFSELDDSLQADVNHSRDALQGLCEQIDQNDEEEERTSRVFSGRDVSISRLKELSKTFQDEQLREAIQAFLDHAALYTSQDDMRNVNAVNLLTIHSAKGLEFPVVFVSGVEKGNLPSFYSVREEGPLREKKLDEQRRLLYVAMTRAKQQLFITYVKKRGDYPKKHSQFLCELGIEEQQKIEQIDSST